MSQEDDMGIDVIPTFEAINLIHPHVSRVIQEMWADDEGVCIAGGFMAFCMGLTTCYTDVDIFVHLHSFLRLSRRLSEGNSSLHLVPHIRQNDNEIVVGYPSDSFYIYEIYEGDRKIDHQVIINTQRWTRYVCDRSTGAVDGVLFAKTLLRDFDLQICRTALYKDVYYCRKGGVNVIPRYMAGDRSARIVKYYSRLNLGHFSDHAEDYMLGTRTENTGVEERLDREGGEGSGV